MVGHKLFLPQTIPAVAPADLSPACCPRSSCAKQGARTVLHPPFLRLVPDGTALAIEMVSTLLQKETINEASCTSPCVDGLGSGHNDPSWHGRSTGKPNTPTAAFHRDPAFAPARSRDTQ